MKKHLLITIVACLVVAGGAFYGGMQYASAKSIGAGSPSGQFRQGGQGRGGAGFAGRGGAGAGGFTNGDVLSKDDKSVTLKMRDGGSKIVFYTSSTKATKMVEGTMDDIAVGTQVVVTGDANSDGSVTAQTIQVRPQGASSQKQ